MDRPAPPEPLWVPSDARKAASQLGRWCRRMGFTSYEESFAWSVNPETAGDFWSAVASEAGVHWHRPPLAPLEPNASSVTGYQWFRGGRLNYAEAALRPPPGGPGSVAVVARSQTREDRELTWAELADLVGRARQGLLVAGVQAGERVAGYLPNIPEALVLMLACASLGAIWTCCSPEMGVAGALDRLAQVEPSLLVSVDGYRYGPRVLHRAAEAEALREALPSLRAAVWLPYLSADEQAGAPKGWELWADFVSKPGELEPVPVDFDHPLYILFSSGTTGKPKPIVHGHGGILLEHAKALRFHFDLGPADRFFWFTTTGWMMWNFCVSGLLVGAAVVLFDGDPAWPGPDALWEMIAQAEVTCAGVGSSYLVACMKAGSRPAAAHDLRRLRTLGATGSPLPAAAARWVYRAVGDDLLLASFSGGTDVCTGFVGASPLHPVWAGEISCRCLGAKVEVFDDSGRPVTDQEGELVLTAPLPSMPVAFWGDDGDRYRAAYFARFPGVWAHGDRACLTARGTVVISGRSDGTLNRGGVRMGTAEFYSVVEGLTDVADSLVVHVEDPSGGPGELWLFVVPAAGAGPLDQDRVRAALRRDLSPRHVPDRIVEIAEVPRTMSGKKLEVPVKRILSGVPLPQALALNAVANPASLEPFVVASRRAQSSARDVSSL
ncbi:MAG TPA: acetoacetate--CoA ligase [Acidimicrobiales bacterium]|nr:acetoacetate--CoA ligase [Acidimicrobiales bacterium]